MAWNFSNSVAGSGTRFSGAKFAVMRSKGTNAVSGEDGNVREATLVQMNVASRQAGCTVAAEARAHVGIHVVRICLEAAIRIDARVQAGPATEIEYPAATRQQLLRKLEEGPAGHAIRRFGV